MSEDTYAQLAQRLREGGVIAYPTEAVWGLGCDPANRRAVERLLALKARPMAKGLILVSGRPEDFRPWLDALPEEARQRVEASWPGPHTWLLPDPQALPVWVKGEHDKVALRLSAHPVVQALCRHFGGPIISTSANPAAQPPARSREAVLSYFGDALDGIAPGELGGLAQPTPIRDALTGEIIRA